MAKPVITYRASNYVTTAGPTFTASPTWTPAANSLCVVLEVGCLASSPADPTGVTGHGLTYTKVVVPTATLSTTHIMSIWVANAGASPTSVAEVATFAGTPTGNALICYEITGWESAEQVINAFGTAINTGTAASGTTGTVTLDLRPDVTSEHVNLAFFLHLANEATTPRASWTETAGADGNFNTPATGAESQWRTDVYELTNTATWTTSINWRGFGLTVRGTATTPRENLHITDTVTADLNPRPVLVPAENIKILGQGRIDIEGGLYLSDIVTVTLDIERPATAENIKIADGAPLPQLNPQPILMASEALKLSESVTPALDLSALLAGENLKLSESATAAPLSGGDESAAPSEALKIATSGQVTLFGVVHVTDSVQAEILVGVQLTESVHITESASGQLSPLQAAVITENLHVTDSVSALPPGGLAASISESLKISEDGYESLQQLEHIKISDSGRINLYGVIHITEVLIVSMAVVGPETATAQEAIHVTEDGVAQLDELEYLTLSDVVTAKLSGLSVVLASEGLRISQTIAALENPLRPPLLSEAVKISQTITTLENPLQGIAAESLRLTDQLTVTALGLVISVAAENLTLNDSLTASISPLVVTALEALHVTDFLAAGFEPAVLLVDESLHVTDAIAASLDLETSAAEGLRISDSVLSVPDLLVNLTERLHLTEQLGAGFEPSVLIIDETLHLSESVQAQMSPLSVAVGNEAVRAEDLVFAVMGTPASAILVRRGGHGYHRPGERSIDIEA